MADGGLSEFFEPAEGKTAFDDPEQEWYFDLPSGAWERQEQKNRELRQTVKRNVSERDGASVPFARNTPAPRRSVAWKSAGGTWGLNQPQAGEGSGVGPAPLRVPRKEGDEPSSSRWNSAVGTYEAAPTRAEDDEDEAQADADDSVVGQMGSSANARSEGETPAATGGPVPLLRRDGRPSAGDADPGSGSMWGGAFGESEPPTKRRVLAAAPLAREGEEAPAVRWISGSLPAGDVPRRGNLWMGADDAASGEEPARPRRNLFAEAVGEGPVPPVPAVEAVPESPAWLDEPYGPEDEPDTTGEEHYLEQLRAGENKAKLLIIFLHSEEARKYHTEIKGLKGRMRWIRILEIPLIGRIIAAIFFFLNINDHMRDLRIIENHMIRLAEQSQNKNVSNFRKLQSMIRQRF